MEIGKLRNAMFSSKTPIVLADFRDQNKETKDPTGIVSCKSGLAGGIHMYNLQTILMQSPFAC